jgi:hypothetical protein
MTSIDDARSNVLKAVLAVRDLLEPWLPDYAVKRRDRREPGRREKEAAEDALFLFLMRHWRTQAKRVRERVEAEKATPFVDDIFDDMSDAELAELTRLLQKNAQNGVTLFGAAAGPTIDYTMTNLQAAEWARKYAGKLIKDIDATSLDVVRKALQTFVETPGFTIGDLMSLLPFDEKRAANIATTEITKAYAQGQIIAGEEMRAQFPDVQITKTWFTSSDDLTCPLCSPLDGKEIEFDQPFYEIEDEDYQDGNPPLHPRCRCWISTSTALAEAG